MPFIIAIAANHTATALAGIADIDFDARGLDVMLRSASEFSVYDEMVLSPDVTSRSDSGGPL